MIRDTFFTAAPCPDDPARQAAYSLGGWPRPCPYFPAVSRKKVIAVIIGLVVAGLVAFLVVWLHDHYRAQIPTQREAQPRIRTEFTIFTETETLREEEALGHRFHFRDQNMAVHLLSLYFVECPATELNENTRLSIARLARYFGDVPLEDLLAAGTRARDETQNLLATRPYRIVTRYEPTTLDTGIYGYVLLEKDDGGEEYLSERLVAQGLAAISSEPSYLPYGEPRERYHKYLMRLERQAREAKRGIWAQSRRPDEGGARKDPDPRIGEE